ncbi:MAG: phosphate ABC transporter ATP-binding protein [Armatimonadetes bacterium]|jgi:phosphate transport system ATP-binding protein|nr:phosphate ABC transporter ATP-binding protein [Armatimonadota bacterium]MDI9582790.1 phosphate ABC transporter ATP-binding protein [Acidobacteriota bacterium]
MAHIDVRNLSVTYGRHQALTNVTVEIPDGAISAVIGPSGCGKTTFLRSLNRLTDMSRGVHVSGEVLIDGENILARGADVTALRRKMGLLSQRPQVLPMSIYDNVAYGPRLHGVRDRKRLDAIVQQHLELASLWSEVKDRLRAPASGLSVGQQQRLCLARGLAVEPEVLLCDEPTASLDPVSAQHIEKRFVELKQEYTIILVTHILRQARRLADYVLYMYMGELVEHGPAEALFNAPSDPRTQAYLSGVIS